MQQRERIRTLLQHMGDHLFEKERILALTLLSSFAGESIFLLGPPGVAKSMIARRLKLAFRDATVLENLMRTSTSDLISKISLLPPATVRATILATRHDP